VIADQLLTERTEITLGSGSHDVAIGVEPVALIAAVDATVADISDPE
jgi:prolyl-tRNA editing enzyme YbaK/EbsC (Cys-tRNA(Pro) deacylase)